MEERRGADREAPRASRQPGSRTGRWFAGRRPGGHRAHTLGDAWRAKRPQCAPPTPGKLARWRSCTTASSRTTCRVKEQLTAEGVTFLSDTDTEVFAQLLDRECASEARAWSMGCGLRLRVSTDTSPPRPCGTAPRGRSSSARGRARRWRSRSVPMAPTSLRMCWACCRTPARASTSRTATWRCCARVRSRSLTSKATRRTPRARGGLESAGLGARPLAALHAQGDPRATGRASAHGLRPRIDLDKGDVTFEDGGFDDAFLQERSARPGRSPAAPRCTRDTSLALPDRRACPCPVDVDFASEFRYRDPVLAPGTMALGSLPVGGDCGHAGRLPTGPRPRRARRFNLQRSRFDPGARVRPGDPHSCRPRDRRCQHQGVYRAGRRRGPAGRPHGPRPRHAGRAGGSHPARRAAHAAAQDGDAAHRARAR